MKIRSTTQRRLDYRNPFMEVNHTRVDFGSFSKDYFVVDLGPRAGVVALRDGHVLMTRQYRFLINAPSWEIPGGKVDANETPEEAAARECREETGVACSDLKPLVVYYPGLDNFNNRTTLLYTLDTQEESSFVPNEAEVTEIGWIPLKRCLEMIYRQEIMDALTITGLLSYARIRTA
jgi:ADP-ribose pyrophosphatase